MNIKLRKIVLRDAQAVLDIYKPYIATSHITFETEVPTLNQYEERILKVTANYPWYVAVLDEGGGTESGKIIGYAYANVFRERAAYAWALETSIYIADDYQGITSHSSPARLLYEKLFEDLKHSGTKQVIGVISLPNDKSIKFHEKMGFKTIGTFPSVGFKNGKWWDVLFMTKFLETLPFSAPRI